VDAIDTRAHVAFRYYETGSPFEYEWVRMLYSTKRQLDIEK
jgi:phospholipid-binding lipoprotein MlaA